MKPRHVILALVALNLGLLATIAVIVFGFNEPSAFVSFPVRVRPASNTVTQIAVRKINATNLLAALAGRSINWRSLESTNYPEFIENLRAFGCPEETIRDIILTDIAKLYTARRAELRAHLPPFRYWETADQTAALIGPRSAYCQQVRQLEQEQRDLVYELLGVDFDQQLARYAGEPEQRGEDYYAFLPEAKQTQVRAVVDKYRRLQNSVYQSGGDVLLKSDLAQLRKLETDRRTELAQILSPEELDDFQLYHSSVARNLRQSLNGFTPSAEEFTTIFRLQKTFEEQLQDAFEGISDDRKAEVEAEATRGAQQALNEELLRELGDQRFAEYQRVTDPDYQTLMRFTERYQMSREAADRIYAMKQEATRQRERLLNNTNLTYEQLTAAITAVAQETRRSVASVLGPQAYQNYQGLGPDWLRTLQTPPPAPEPEPALTLPPGTVVLPPPPIPLPGINVPMRVRPE